MLCFPELAKGRGFRRNLRSKAQEFAKIGSFQPYFDKISKFRALLNITVYKPKTHYFNVLELIMLEFKGP